MTAIRVSSGEAARATGTLESPRAIGVQFQVPTSQRRS